MEPPRRPGSSISSSGCLTLLLPGLAGRDADSIQSDSGDDLVNLQRGHDLIEAADEEVAKRIDPSFILDSGTSYHATSDKPCLSEFAEPAAEDTATLISTRGGRKLPIAGTGTVASKNFHLHGVRYAPDLPPGTVLVSVQQLAASGYHVMFGAGRCMVMGGNGDQVGQGRLQEGDGGRYRLEFLKIPLDAAAERTE